MSEQPASAAANGASPKAGSPSDAAAAGTSGKGSDAVPPSASLPARPVLQGLKRWGVDMQWPHATPEEIIAAGGGFTAGGITKCVWKLVLVTFFLSIYGTVDGDMFKPFLFSRVHCCAAAEPFLGTEYDAAASAAAALDGSYNLTTAAAIDHYFGHGSYAGGLTNVDACSVPDKDRDSTYWSGSTHCTNKAYVQQQAQSLNGIYSALRTYGTMLVLPVGGHVADCWGRKKVYFLTGISSIGITLMYYFDTIQAGGDLHGPSFFFWGALIHAFHAPNGPAGNAMIVDMLHSTKLGVVLPLMAVATTVGPVIGNAVGYTITAVHLDDYSTFWAVCGSFGLVVLGGVWFGLVETLPEADRTPFTPLKWLKEYFLCLDVLREDFALLKIWYIVFFVWTSIGAYASIQYNFMVGSLGFSTEEALVPGFFGQGAAIVGALVASATLPRLGGWSALCWSMIGAIFSCLLIALGGHWGIYASYVSFSLCYAFMAPAYTMVSSVRVDAANQGKTQASMTIASNMGYLVGSTIWSFGIYDARADPGNCDYREVQEGDPPDHPIGCLGIFDGWGAKMPFVWAALLYLCTATFCWHTAIRNGGWKPALPSLQGASAEAIDTKGKFEGQFAARGRRPPAAPYLANMIFGAQFGAVMLGTPGLFMNYGYLDAGCLRDLNCSDVIPSATLLCGYAPALLGALLGMRYMHKKTRQSGSAARSSLLASSALGGGGDDSSALRGTVIDTYTPSFDRAIAVTKDDVVTVIAGGGDDEWMKVRSESTGKEGYVPRSFIAFTAASKAGSVPPPPLSESGSGATAQQQQHASPMRGGEEEGLGEAADGPDLTAVTAL